MLTKRIGIGALLPAPPYLSRNFVRGQGLSLLWARFDSRVQTLPTESASQVSPGRKQRARSVVKKQTVPEFVTDSFAFLLLTTPESAMWRASYFGRPRWLSFRPGRHSHTGGVCRAKRRWWSSSWTTVSKNRGKTLMVVQDLDHHQHLQGSRTAPTGRRSRCGR